MLSNTKTKKPLTPKEKAKDVFSWVGLIVMAICFVIVCNRVYVMRTTGEQAFILGYRPAVVLTGSMEPYMMTHSLCLNKEINSPDDVEVGDIITYKVDTNDGKFILVTHRVIAIEDGLYYFKGDNNNVADGYGLPYENLVSEVTHVWNGGVQVVDLALWFADQWKADNIGKFICISAGVGVVCAYHLLCMLLEFFWHLIFAKKKEEDTGEIEQPDTTENTLSEITEQTHTTTEQVSDLER